MPEFFVLGSALGSEGDGSFQEPVVSEVSTENWHQCFLVLCLCDELLKHVSFLHILFFFQIKVYKNFKILP